jgi:hypothetical protein
VKLKKEIAASFFNPLSSLSKVEFVADSMLLPKSSPISFSQSTDTGSDNVSATTSRTKMTRDGRGESFRHRVERHSKVAVVS